LVLNDDDITSLNYRTLLAERIIETLEAFNLLKLEDRRTFNDVLADTVLDVPPQHYRLGRAPYLGNEGASDVVNEDDRGNTAFPVAAPAEVDRPSPRGPWSQQHPVHHDGKIGPHLPSKP
jgi:hypothetical protein